MKKILLAAAVCALASFNSFGAACVSGPVSLGAFNQACQVSNGSYSWTLSNIAIRPGSVASSGFNSPIPDETTLTNSLNIAWAAAGTTGFSLTYTLNSPYNAWSNQDLQFTNGVWVTADNVDSNVIAIGLRSNTTGSAYTGISKAIQDQTGATVHNTLTVVFDSFSGGGDAFVGTTSSFNAPLLSVNDRIVFDARTTQAGARSGTLNSYTNYFYAAEPQTGVPEPMTFVLMGAGLVGIAALRRRNG